MNIQVCWALSVLLLVISIAVFFRSRPFGLIIKPGRKILWVDENKNLRIDVSVGFYNVGSSAGSVEEVTLSFSPGEKQFFCQPDMTYRFNDEGKLTPSGFWDSFLLNGKHHREQIIGFKTDIPVSDLPDGSYDVILNVRYHKSLRQKKFQEISHPFPVEFRRRDVMRDSLHSQKKKQPFFPFDPNILQGLFSPKSGV